MPENLDKIPIPRSASPVARSGAGDISERELSREKYNLQTTPPNRVQPAHPKKQLFSAPVNKFTAKSTRPTANLARIKSCLDHYAAQSTPSRPVKVGPKAVSMEDLTPTKRIKKERKEDLPIVRSPGLHCVDEEEAAAKICKFLMLSAWRRRRDEVRCVRKTLEFQVSCSERLRLQVCALKSLLDSDNAKVRLAIRELERLKQLLKDKEMEKNVLEREKMALEQDVSVAEDRASEMSIGWRNSRNELEGVYATLAASERALAQQRAQALDARVQRDHALHRLSELERDLSQHEELLTSAEAEARALRREADEKQMLLDKTTQELKQEQMSRERLSDECSLLNARITFAGEETALLKSMLDELRAELRRLDLELRATRERLDWWPRPLTRMLGAARSLFRAPLSVPEAVLWSLVPARHGC